MPAALDLVGRSFGRLTVIAAGERLARGRRWVCQCECGRTSEVTQHSLIRATVTACETCRFTRTCAVCGESFLSRQSRATCSDACRVAHQRRIHLAHYYRRVDADPQFNRKRAARERQRAATDPAFDARWRARWRQAGERYKARMAADPNFRERERAKARAWYARHAQRVQQDRKRKRASLDAATLARQRMAQRAAGRSYAAKRRETIRSDPQLYRQHLQRMRAAGAKSYRKAMADPQRRAMRQRRLRQSRRTQSLQALMRAGAALRKRHDGTDENA